MPPLLLRLFHHRWTIPVLAELHRHDGRRFVQLANGLEASREALSAALEALGGMGLAERNPGYGHPLRPEYILTPAGERIGAPCLAFRDAAAAAGLDALVFRKWPMPVLHAVHGGEARFNGIRRALEPITARALSLCIAELEGPPLLRRRGDGLVLSAKGGRLAELLAPIA